MRLELYVSHQYTKIDKPTRVAVCVCRGAPLSQGWLATTSSADEESSTSGSSSSSSVGHTCVVCPYHGWAFDGEGKLRDVPSAEPGRWPKRPVVSAYPVSCRWWWMGWAFSRVLGPSSSLFSYAEHVLFALAAPFCFWWHTLSLHIQLPAHRQLFQPRTPMVPGTYGNSLLAG